MIKSQKLVLVHGFLGNALNWLPIQRRLEKAQSYGLLSKNWQIQCVDLLGHGKKADLSAYPSFSIDDICQDLLRELGNESFVAVGHSFGLRPLLKISESQGLKSPLQRLIVEDSSPVLSFNGFEELRKVFHELPDLYASRKAAKDFFLGVWGSDSKMPGFLLTNIVERDGQYGWRIDRPKLSKLLEASKVESLWSAWESFDGPIDMIMGADSSFVPQERIKECVERRASKQTQLHFIPGSGHWVHADQAELFTNLLIEILKIS